MADNTHTPQEAYDMMAHQVKEGNLKGNFIDSMMSQFESKGRLSPKQVTWAIKLSKEAAQKAIDAQDTEMQMSEMEDAPYPAVVAFMKKADMKKARMTFTVGRLTTTLSLAPAHGKNPDHIYVKCNDQYVGKITPVGHLVARDGYYKMGAQAILDDMVAKGVETYVLSYGQKSGNCCLCSRKLTDDRSLVAGVGPICAKRYDIQWG
jgi:hypothetical protein